MALNFFKQRDIEAMDANDIPEEFKNYFDSLSEERKHEILQPRPDLAVGLGYTMPSYAAPSISSENSEASKRSIPHVTKDNHNSDQTVPKDNSAQNDELAQIRHNIYKNVNLDKIIVNGLEPVEALVIPDGTKKCPIHRIPFADKSVKYQPRGRVRSTYGVIFHVCRSCKRIFIEESKAGPIHKAFTERNIRHVFYDKDITGSYIRSQIKEYKLGDNEKIYYPDSWIEDKPICPIHEAELFELKVTKSYKDRKVAFKGYYCDQCNKIIIRRSAVSGVLDQCGETGVPLIETERLVRQKPVKKPIPKKDVKPDYFVEDGERVRYSYKYNTDCYRLSEDDTVIVSDSIYCNLSGHQTKEVLALINVDEKSNGRKAYLVMVGYCSDCGKFYIDQDDYKVIHAYGRPAVIILSDIEDEIKDITSGEVYNLERKHLKKVEDAIDAEADYIHAQPDYVGRYQTGSYDDGNLNFAKNFSIQKYEPRLKELGAVQPKPYVYRVDISAEGETKTYYVGASDLTLAGKQEVVSFNSDFGRNLVNYQTLKIKQGGKEYHIKLSRQFDIENARLYSYVNLRTDEDIIFRSGITDPFLVRVLNIRKRQHNLVDIIATIQENQNRIVDTDFNKNIVVQGCAGSGKTMVLLHRLSALQYKQRRFDFTNSAVILTPNEQFNLHIQGLAEGLQISNIHRFSVEEYYQDRLLDYSPEFKTETRVVSEMLVPQNFVDYVYSNQFRIDFNDAYEKIITERNNLSVYLNSLAEHMGREKFNVNFSNPDVMDRFRIFVEGLDSEVKRRENNLQKALDAVAKSKALQVSLNQKRKKAEETVTGFMQEALPRVYRKIGDFVGERRLRIAEIEKELSDAQANRERTENSLFPIGRRARLENLDRDIAEVKRKLDNAHKLEAEEDAVLSKTLEGLSEDELFAWIRQVMLLIPNVQEEIQLYNRYVKELERLTSECQQNESEIEKQSIEVVQLRSELYDDDVKHVIKYLLEKAKLYTVSNTFKMIFDNAVYAYKKEHNIERIVGNWHRYDLYAELIFAMKFFNYANGTTRFMCIDEGQDLSMGEYRLIYELNQHNVIFNIYGDTNQLIKPGRGISDWSELERVFRATEYRLNENYRNTNQITRFCNSNFNMDVLRTGVDGPSVKEIARNELEQELSGLKITTERIAVLVPRSVQKGRYIHRDELGYGIRSILGEEIGNGRIAVKYVDEVKGIEFDRVYVVGNKMSRNEKYIAYTRALSNLIVVVDESA